MFTNTSLTKRIEARLQTKVTANTSTVTGAVERFDLKMWDHEIVGPHEAKMLVGYSPELGIPKRSEIDQWIIRQFNGSVRTILETIRPYEDMPVVTAHVVKIAEVRPFEHSKNMIAVSASAFMDDGDSVWEVRKVKDGSKYLARVSKEDLDELLKAHERTTKTASVHDRPRLAHLQSPGSVIVEKGDRVAFTHNGVLTHGEVTSVLPDGSVRVSANGQEIKLQKPSIFEVKKVSPKSTADTEAGLIDFFTRAYGDKGFATELVTGKKPKK